MFPSCYLVKFYPLFLSMFKSGCNDHCHDHAWMSHMKATLSSISSFLCRKIVKPSNSLLLLLLPISNVIPSLCPTWDCIYHVSCQSIAGNSILFFNILFTKTGGEFKTLKVYSTCTKEVSSMCLVFDYMFLSLCS